MDFDLRWLFIAASLGLCAWAGWQFVHRLARARLLGDVPTSRIRSAAQGFVELYGVLEEGPEGPLQAPLTGKPCLWWRYRIEVEEKRSGREKAWRTVDKGASESPFGLRDATDACLVDPRGAEVRPLTQQRWEAFREARSIPCDCWRASAPWSAESGFTATPRSACMPASRSMRWANSAAAVAVARDSMPNGRRVR